MVSEGLTNYESCNYRNGERIAFGGGNGDDDEDDVQQLGPKAFVIPDDEDAAEADSDDDEDVVHTGIVRMFAPKYHYASSTYSSSSSESDSRCASPVQEDSNSKREVYGIGRQCGSHPRTLPAVFLSEEITSLNRS